MKRLLITGLYLLALNLSVFAATETGKETKKEHNWFSGGAMLHWGYAYATNEFGPITGLVSGIGGRIHSEFLPHFRFGTGGTATEVNYESPGLKGSYLRLTYGGITLEGWYQWDWFRISVGVLIGYGSVKNLHIISDNGVNQTVSFKEYGTWVFLPMVTMEFFVTKNIAVTVIVDQFLGTAIGNGFQLGTRSHVGFIFYR